MADPQGTVFGDKAVQQIAKTVREVSRRIRNEKPERGRWQFQGGSGGGGATVTKIRFKIASSDPNTFTALVDILAWDAGFGMDDVPYQIGTPELPIRVVEVCDPAGCFLNEPAEDLFDRAGWAMLMDGSPGGFCREGYGPFLPVWEVIQLCCRPYSCNVDQ